MALCGNPILVHPLLLLGILLLILRAGVSSGVQARLPPVHCNASGCTVSYYQGGIWGDRAPCKAAMAAYPTTEEELLQAVASAARSRTKVKVVSKNSHSVPKLVCPGGEEGLAISTRDYNSQILVDTAARTVTADAGVMLRDLIDAIAEHGLALAASTYWDGVSVAGMISTGAHGSSLWGRGSYPHDYVVKLRLVVPASADEGYAKVVELSSHDADLDAARLSLGVLGAISKVTFLLEPLFKRSVSLAVREDETLEDDIWELATQHEFGCLYWYPSTGKSLFKIDDRVSLDTEGDGAYKLPIVEKVDVASFRNTMAILEDAERNHDTKRLCEAAEMALHNRHSHGDGLMDAHNTFAGYPVVGFNNKMQTAGGCCDDEVLHSSHIMKDSTQVLKEYVWNPPIGFSFYDTSITVPVGRYREVVADINKLRDGNRHRMCGFEQVVGIWIRFVKGSSAYLSQREDGVVFEVIYYRSEEANIPRLDEDIVEEIEQMLLFKFGGKPHWGKNRALAFQGMKDRTSAMDKFLEARKRLDPLGLFSSEWSDAILGIENLSSSSGAPSPSSVQTYHEHCALEGLCVCREDFHCHPSKGYFCRPGLVYKEAQVCRYEGYKHEEL